MQRKDGKSWRCVGTGGPQVQMLGAGCKGENEEKEEVENTEGDPRRIWGERPWATADITKFQRRKQEETFELVDLTRGMQRAKGS